MQSTGSRASRRVFVVAVILLAASAFAQQNFQNQTTNFTFDKTSAITSYNGSDPANPPYPGDMGAINLDNQNPGISVPWQLGYLNNGYLQPCNSFQWTPKKWIIGDGTHNGDEYQVSMSTACPYFTGEYGTYEDSNNTYDSFSAVATYTTKLVLSCSRYRGCHYFPQYSLLSGQGTIVQIVTQ